MTVLDRIDDEREEQLDVWVDVCALADLIADRGVCVLVGEYQVAIFKTSADESLYALSNYDPFSGTYVLSRGIVGSTGECLKVASPIFKQSFDLRTGRSVDDPSVSVMTFPVHARGGRVLVRLP